MSVPASKLPAAQHYPSLDLSNSDTQDAPQEKEAGWLVSFVDILTLLLTLLVLLLAFNQLSQHEQNRHTASPTSTPPVSLTHDDPPPQPAAASDHFTIPADIRDKVDMVATSSEVDLVIKDDVLFDEGSPDLKTTGAAVLEHIARRLSQSDYPISVEGHTDNIPIHTAQFPSNWELSSFRATTVTRYFIAHGIAVERLRATGYADTRPIADNATANGRARNRRVSLVVHVNESADAQQANLTKPGNASGNPDKS